MAPMHILGLLLLAHFLADYPLQGDFLSKAKNRYAPIPGVPAWQALFAHSFIQAGFVWLITGSAIFGVAEFFIHALTDDLKCRGDLTFNGDQLVHVGCKIIYVVTIATVGPLP